MGKDTGFLEYSRKENTWQQPLDRIKSFKEFKLPLNKEERQKQASRCMNCGVPMCQSAIKLAGMVTGCPLHNLIPDWNDDLYSGELEEAAKRLTATSSFPEFTGRVCPALCEKACNCACDSLDGAVTVHDNELFIIETAFANGWITARPPKIRTDKKVAVVGSGPAGLAVADLLNRRGHNVTVYEREDRAGGLLMYGIPNMKLNKRIVERRINLMVQEGVNFIYNADVGKSIDAKELVKEYDAVVLCCGAKKARGLNVAENDAKGLIYAVDFLKSVTKSLLDSNLKDKNFFDPKGKHVVIVGGGDTGNDCTGTCIRLGAESVTQIEMMPCPPTQRSVNNPWPQWPKILKTDYGQQEAISLWGKDPRIYETTIKEIYTQDKKVCGVKTVQVEFKTIDGKRQLVERQGSEKDLKADLVLVAAGFTGCEDYTAQAFEANLGPRGTVAVESENSFATGIPKVFTAGDMRRGQSLVVWAISEGRDCARQVDKFLMGYTNL